MPEWKFLPAHTLLRQVLPYFVQAAIHLPAHRESRVQYKFYLLLTFPAAHLLLHPVRHFLLQKSEEHDPHGNPAADHHRF